MGAVSSTPLRAVRCRSQQLFDWLYDTPIFRHWFLCAISLVTAGHAAPAPTAGGHRDGRPAAGGLAFAASFFQSFSIACDYRYLYFTDLAAIAGLIYLRRGPALAAAKACGGVHDLASRRRRLTRRAL